MNLVFQQAIANSIPADGTLIAVIPPEKGIEYVAPFFPIEPLDAKIVRKFPLGIRVNRKNDGKLQLVVSGLDFAWGIDSKRAILPASFFTGGQDCFGKKVNKRLGYAAAQHPDRLHTILEYPDRVSFDPLLRLVIVMNSDGFVAHDYMLRALVKYCPEGRKIIPQILDIAPADLARQISHLFAAVLTSR